MLQHKTELHQNEDGSIVIDVQLMGNAAELTAISLGKVHGGFVKNEQNGAEQLDIRLKLSPVPLEVVTDEPSKEDVKKLDAKARGPKSHDEENEEPKKGKAKSA